MPQIQALPKNPLKKLKQAGYTYAEFARKHGFKPDTVRRTMARYQKLDHWPRKTSTARKIIVTFFQVTKPKKQDRL